MADEITVYRFLTWLFLAFSVLFGAAFVILMRIYAKQFWVCTNLDHGPGGASRFVPRGSKCPGCDRREGES